MTLNSLQQRIVDMKKAKNALLLVHNYQVPEIQEIADFLGDSLELCRKAQEAKDVDMIVFCGVDFMAETAKVLNPSKKVVIPSGKAVCPMAGMLSMDVLREAKAKYPDAPVVLYVNTLAEAKAEAINRGASIALFQIGRPLLEENRNAVTVCMEMAQKMVINTMGK